MYLCCQWGRQRCQPRTRRRLCTESNRKLEIRCVATAWSGSSLWERLESFKDAVRPKRAERAWACQEGRALEVIEPLKRYSEGDDAFEAGQAWESRVDAIDWRCVIVDGEYASTFKMTRVEVASISHVTRRNLDSEHNQTGSELCHIYIINHYIQSVRTRSSAASIHQQREDLWEPRQHLPPRHHQLASSNLSFLPSCPATLAAPPFRPPYSLSYAHSCQNPS